MTAQHRTVQWSRMKYWHNCRKKPFLCSWTPFVLDWRLKLMCYFKKLLICDTDLPPGEVGGPLCRPQKLVSLLPICFLFFFYICFTQKSFKRRHIRCSLQCVNVGNVISHMWTCAHSWMRPTTPLGSSVRKQNNPVFPVSHWEPGICTPLLWPEGDILSGLAEELHWLWVVCPMIKVCPRRSQQIFRLNEFYCFFIIVWLRQLGVGNGIDLSGWVSCNINSWASPVCLEVRHQSCCCCNLWNWAEEPLTKECTMGM